MNNTDFLAIVSHSEDPETKFAIQEIIDQCSRKLNGQEPKGGLLFCGINFDHQYIIKSINDRWPDLELIGCTTDGEISSELGFQEDSITLLLLGGNKIHFSSGLGKEVSKDINSASKNAVIEALSKTDQKPAICFMLPQGLVVNSERILRNVKHELGSKIPVFGATAADQWKFTGTLQFYKDKVVTDTVPVLILSGPLKYSYAVESGWKPIGHHGIVTKSDGNILIEVDGKPAINFYKSLLGDKGVPSPEYPMAIMDDNNEIIYLRATPGSDVNKDTGAITFIAEIPEGSKIQIAVATRDDILTACRNAVLNSKQNYPEGKDPQLAILFSCAGRKFLLGSHTKEEVEIVKSELKENLPIIGFYGYGEIGPQNSIETNSKFHNQTFISILLGV